MNGQAIEIEKYILIINICASFIGLVGNTIASVVIACSRSLYTLTDFYLLSLSIADLLNLITKILAEYYLYYSHTITKVQCEECFTPESHVFNNTAADFINSLIFQTSVYASVLTVTAFTVERYLAICHPFFAQSMPKTSRVKTIIITIWSISALFALMQVTLPLFAVVIGTGLFVRIHNYTTRLLACLCFFMPNLAIIVMCILIGCELKRCSKERPMTLQTNRSDLKVLKMFVIIIVISFLSWAPYFTLLIIDIYIENEKNLNYFFYIVVYRLTTVTFNLPSVVNPIIYTIMSKNFRDAFKNLLSKSWTSCISSTSVTRSRRIGETNLEMT